MSSKNNLQNQYVGQSLDPEVKSKFKFLKEIGYNRGFRLKDLK